jgi:hypothetical protein
MKLTFLWIFSIFNEVLCAKYSYELYNFTAKSMNLDVVDKLDVKFNKYRFNVTAMVKVPLNDIYVSVK